LLGKKAPPSFETRLRIADHYCLCCQTNTSAIYLLPKPHNIGDFDTSSSLFSLPKSLQQSQIAHQRPRPRSHWSQPRRGSQPAILLRPINCLEADPTQLKGPLPLFSNAWCLGKTSFNRPSPRVIDVFELRFDRYRIFPLAIGKRCSGLFKGCPCGARWSW
jgi:hypothetical protein